MSLQKLLDDILVQQSKYSELQNLAEDVRSVRDRVDNLLEYHRTHGHENDITMMELAAKSYAYSNVLLMIARRQEAILNAPVG